MRRPAMQLFTSERSAVMSFFFNDTATTEIYTLSLHDALPILAQVNLGRGRIEAMLKVLDVEGAVDRAGSRWIRRSEEHTSELQSRQYLVCRLLLEKKKRLLRALIRAHLYTPFTPISLMPLSVG